MIDLVLRYRTKEAPSIQEFICAALEMAGVSDDPSSFANRTFDMAQLGDQRQGTPIIAVSPAAGKRCYPVYFYVPANADVAVEYDRVTKKIKRGITDRQPKPQTSPATTSPVSPVSTGDDQQVPPATTNTQPPASPATDVVIVSDDTSVVSVAQQATQQATSNNRPPRASGTRRPRQDTTHPSVPSFPACMPEGFYHRYLGDIGRLLDALNEQWKKESSGQASGGSNQPAVDLRDFELEF